MQRPFPLPVPDIPNRLPVQPLVPGPETLNVSSGSVPLVTATWTLIPPKLGVALVIAIVAVAAYAVGCQQDSPDQASGQKHPRR